MDLNHGLAFSGSNMKIIVAKNSEEQKKLASSCDVLRDNYNEINVNS